MNPGFPVSLAMIVKNEARTLEKCLQSVGDFVAEVVVVDTGSGDSTMTIARSAGATVIECPWEDDFSSVRNRALDACSQPWALVLDADESLHFPCPDRAADLWSEALGNQAMAGYELLLHNLDPRGARTSSIRALRLFRNVPEVRYHYPIHEQIVDVLVRYGRSRGLGVMGVDVEILHTGYGITNPEKLARNARILERATAADPDDPFLWYNLGKTWSHAHFDKGAASTQALLRAREILSASPARRDGANYLPDLYHFLGEGLVGEGRLTEALDVLEEALRFCGPEGELTYDRALVLLRLDRHEEAARAFRACLEMPQRIRTWIGTQGTGSYLAWDGLGQALCRVGELQEGIACFKRAIELEPSVLTSRYNLVEVYRAIGAAKEALAILMEIVERYPQERSAWEMGAKLLEGLGLTQHASRWASEAARAGRS